NMRLDEHLARALMERRGSPTLRVYGWSPPAVSLGWNQDIGEIDRDAASRDGVDVVRRPTGGRAILHDQEVTYAVIMRSDGNGIAAVYRTISEALVAGLKTLGVDAKLERSQPDFPSVYRDPTGTACFSVSARHEIVVDGKKLVGSAQRRFPGGGGPEVVLQHGSILLGPGHRRLSRYLSIPDEQRRRIASVLGARTTDLAEILHSPPSFDEVADAIRRGFELSWGIAFRDGETPPLVTAPVYPSLTIS
ncbi:MAG: lipoate--protein ligase family protein, partial [Bacteroidota bacterium]